MKQKVLKEEVDQILSQAFWQKGGVRITENTEVTQDQEVAQDEQVDQQEQIEEAAEGHVCPLCESQLHEAISDEQLSEHVDFMVSVISEMEDITDEDLTELAEEIVSDEDEDEEEQVAEAKKGMPAALLAMMKGKKAKG
jgi:DNA repair exonuclease SbcCD ATPase subunit